MQATPLSSTPSFLHPLMLCPAFPFLSLLITPECPMAWLLLQGQEQEQEEEGWVTALTALAVRAAGHSGDLAGACRKGNALHIDPSISLLQDLFLLKPQPSPHVMLLLKPQPSPHSLLVSLVLNFVLNPTKCSSILPNHRPLTYMLTVCDYFYDSCSALQGHTPGSSSGPPGKQRSTGTGAAGTGAVTGAV
jgi:hypothetical protein